MRRTLVVLVASLSLIGSANAMVLFNFDGVSYPGGPTKIETYMEGIYNSDITVKHAIVGDGVFHGPLWNYAGDHYIQNIPGVSHWFSITFNQVPIVAMSFDWGVRKDNLHVYADGNLVFQSGWYNWKSGSWTIQFSSPVSELKFTDGFLGEIEIDNLRVGAIPEPNTLLLFSSGLLGIGALGRLRRRKK